MKKLLLILLIIVVLAIAGLAIFILTFNADRYRPLVQGKIEEALGRPVQLGRISLGWRGGIALELRGLSVYENAQAQTTPALFVEKVSAVVQLLPLLKRDIQVASLAIIRPSVQITKRQDGTVSVAGVSPPAQTQPPASTIPASSPQPSAGSAPAPLPLFADVVEVRDGVVRFTDTTQQPPVELRVNDVDMTLRNVSLINPIDIEAHLALFSESQNVSFTSRVQPPMNDRAAIMEAARLEVDLGRIQVAELTNALSMLKAVVRPEPLAGTVMLTIDRLVLDAHGIEELAAKVHLSGGRIAPAALKSPVEELTADAIATPNRIDLQRFSGRLAGGTFAVAGTIDQLKTQPQSTVNITIDGLAIDQLVPPPPANEPQLRGRFSAKLQGTVRGMKWSEWSHTLSGRGELSLIDGVVANLNVLREVFHRLSILPGLVALLESRLPQSYQEKLAQRDTVLQPVHVPVAATNGVFIFERLPIATDTFELDGKGSLALDGTLTSQAAIRIEPELSAAIIKSVKELRYLADAQGRIEIPLKIDGTLPRVPAIVPDVQYVASRLAASKTQELLGGVLDRALGTREHTPQPQDGGGAPASNGQQAPPQTTPETKDFLGNILRGVLEQGSDSKSRSTTESGQPTR